MTERPIPLVPPWLRSFPAIVGTLVAAIGAAVLLGWAQDVDFLRRVGPAFGSMKPNAAAGFVALGAALALAAWRVRGAEVARWPLELAALAIGAATILEYVAKIDLGIDSWLFRAPQTEFQAAAPGRMSVVTAVCFVLAAGALLAERDATARGRAIARTLGTCIGIVGLVSLLGYLYGAPVLYRPSPGTTAMAVHAAVALMLFGAGIVALRPEYGLPSIATGRTLIGTHVRWLFPVAVLIPLLLGGLAVQTYQAFGVARASIALTAAGSAVLIGLAIGLAARWLRRMESRLEVTNRALAATRQGVFIADGTQLGRPIIYVNEAFTELTGYSPKDALGQRCDFLVSTAPEDAALRTLGECLATEGSCTVTVPSKRRDGTVFSGRLSITTVPSADDSRHIVGLLEDVTAEQLASMARLELLAEASQARKDAEAANRVKDVFFASVTHELRSPLNACLMWLDVLALGPLSDKAAKGVDAIKRNLKIQTRLVNDLIDAAKISSGGIEIHREPLEIETLLENAAETWRLMAAAKQVEFVYAPRGERQVLNGDPERLQQVLNNLLENAFANTPREGRVELRVRDAAGAVEIDVADSGAGLSHEDLQRVFTPFWRVRSGHSEHKGLGLGLAIAEHLVKGHQGALTAASEGPGKGCVFTVRLPLATMQMRDSRGDAARMR